MTKDDIISWIQRRILPRIEDDARHAILVPLRSRPASVLEMHIAMLGFGTENSITFQDILSSWPIGSVPEDCLDSITLRLEDLGRHDLARIHDKLLRIHYAQDEHYTAHYALSLVKMVVDVNKGYHETFWKQEGGTWKSTLLTLSHDLRRHPLVNMYRNSDGDST